MFGWVTIVIAFDWTVNHLDFESQQKKLGPKCHLIADLKCKLWCFRRIRESSQDHLTIHEQKMLVWCTDIGVDAEILTCVSGVHHKNLVTMDKINPKDCQVLSLGDSGFF